MPSSILVTVISLQAFYIEKGEKSRFVVSHWYIHVIVQSGCFYKDFIARVLLSYQAWTIPIFHRLLLWILMVKTLLYEVFGTLKQLLSLCQQILHKPRETSKNAGPTGDKNVVKNLIIKVVRNCEQNLKYSLCSMWCVGKTTVLTTVLSYNAVAISGIIILAVDRLQLYGFSLFASCTVWMLICPVLPTENDQTSNIVITSFFISCFSQIKTHLINF